MPDDLPDCELPPTVSQRDRRRAARAGIHLPSRAWPAIVHALIAAGRAEQASTPAAPARMAAPPPLLIAARPLAAGRQRRSAPGRKASTKKTADPEPARPAPGSPGRPETHHPEPSSCRAAPGAMGERMPGPRHIGDILAGLLPRLSREWGVS